MAREFGLDQSPLTTGPAITLDVGWLTETGRSVHYTTVSGSHDFPTDESEACQGARELGPCAHQSLGVCVTFKIFFTQAVLAPVPHVYFGCEHCAT